MAAYPFCRLSGPANVLVMPARHSAAISTNMLQELGGSTVLGPLLVGFDKPVQISALGARLRHRQHGGARGVLGGGVSADFYLPLEGRSARVASRVGVRQCADLFFASEGLCGFAFGD